MRLILSTLLIYVSSGALLSLDAQETPKSFKIYYDCILEDESVCEALYQEAFEEASAVESDTLRAGLFLELSEIRKDLGYWDDEVESLINSAINIYKEGNYTCNQAQALRNLASFYLYNEDGDKAFELCEEALEMAQSCGKDAIIARVYGTLGVALQFKGEYAKALEAHSEEARIYTRLEDLEGVGVSTQEMANIYASMDDMARANEMMLEAAELYKEVGDEMRYAVCITDLCANFLELGQPDSVIKYLPTAGEIFKGKHRIGEAMVAYNMGDAYLQKDVYPVALDYYTDAAELAEGVGYTRLEMEIEISRSQCYDGMGQYDKAYEHILKAEEIGKGTSSAEGTLNLLQFKMDAAHKVGLHDEAHDAALAYIDLKDSLRSARRDQEIALLQEEFEAEKKAHEIDKLTAEAELDDQKKKALIAILALVILAALIIINRESQRRKKSKQLHDTEIKLKEAKEAALLEELEFKKRELASKALQISQKNEVLEGLRVELKNFALKNEADKSVNEVLNALKIERSIDGNWEEFTRQFQEVNPDFYKRLSSKGASMSKNDLRLAALIRMNLSSKEIASILNITPDGVKKARHRFRKKLELNPEESLESFVLNL